MGVRKATEKEKDDFKYDEAFLQMKLSHFFAPNSVKYDVDGLYIFDWESDKFIETKSGLIYEFEIKVSQADFKNDFKHKKDKHIILEGEEKYGDKYLPRYYELLEENKKRGAWCEASFHKWADDNKYYLVGGHKRPNFFYYAVPPGLIDVEDVPWYAGLVYVYKSGLITIKKKAPKLHSDKIKDDELGLGEKFYYNMDKWRQKCRQAWTESRGWREKFEAELEAKGQGMAYKEMESLVERCKKTCSDLEERSRKSADQLHRDLWHQNRMVSCLAREIRKYNPEFNFFKFEEEIFGKSESTDVIYE